MSASLERHYAAHETGSASLQDCPPSCDWNSPENVAYRAALAAPVADRFTRRRLTVDDLRALPKGTMLLLSTRWSEYQALVPVLLQTVDASDTVAYESAVPGHAPWPQWITLAEGRFYRFDA